MVPVARVVTAPRGCVALAAGIAGARHHEGPHIRLELLEALEGSAAVLHAEDVVNFEMARCPRRESRLIDAMLHIVRHGLRWNLEERRLIHVVPEAGHAFAYEV